MANQWWSDVTQNGERNIPVHIWEKIKQTLQTQLKSANQDTERNIEAQIQLIDQHLILKAASGGKKRKSKKSKKRKSRKSKKRKSKKRKH